MPNTREKLIELQKAAIREFMSSVTDVPLADFIADYLIANGVTVQEWISVKDRLPDLELAEAKANDCDSFVCLTSKRGFANKDQIFIIKAWYYGDRFENDDGIDITDDVTHWMPLPQPPKGE